MRRRRSVLALLVAVTGVTVAVVISRPTMPARTTGPGHSATPAPGAVGATTTTPPATTTPLATTVPTTAQRTGGYGIGSLATTFVEPGKALVPPHSPGGTVAVVRQVVVDVLYPRAGAPGGAPVAGAAPAGAGGPFPLLLFGPGFNESWQAYLPLIQAWVAHGYVVAAITFPLTNPGAPGGVDRADLLNQPGDMVAVAHGIATDSANASSPLHGLVNTSKIAAIGQSDGGDTALALAYNSCCQALRVQAAVILSGAELGEYGGFPGSWFPASTPPTPLLAFQGTADTNLNPPSETNKYFAEAPQPKHLVCLTGADHLDAYTEANQYEQLVATASIDFLDHVLRGRANGLSAMGVAVSASGVAQLTSSCPTT